nr:uncharacterized protein LOC116779249 isoform X3 [Danaus plexippus plexippus]
MSSEFFNYRAWVTLATNDSYGLGALVLAHSLRRASSSYPAVVLITPSVTEPMRERLRAVFAEVILVDVLDSKDAAHLALLQRPELGITFTKIHCWNLTQYEKCVFLDADTLIVQNCDELFEREELSAAPDVGWPDCFNSGVFVFKPSADTFSKLVTFASERGSFDGGDQGLLNSYFSDWAHGDINKHLPFLYNVTSAAFYSYIPALKHYGQNLKIIHFIGAAKPWLQHFNWQSRSVEAPEHLRGFLQLWWDLFVAQVHSQLDTQMAEEVPLGIDLEEEEPSEYDEPVQDYSFYEPTLDPSSEFPWHRPYDQIKNTESIEPSIDIGQFHDPWQIYRGNIPPSKDDASCINATESHRQYAWDYMQPQTQHYTPENSHNSENTYTQNYNSEIWQYNSEHSSQPQTTQQFTTFTPSISSQWEESQCNINVHDQHYHTPIQEIIVHHDHYPSHSNQQSSPESQNQPGDHQGHNNHQSHTHHQHIEHHQNNYQNYNQSHHHENDQNQNDFTQQRFESHVHEQNQNYNYQHSSEHHHESQSYHDPGFEQSHQRADYYQDKHDSQSLFHNHSHSNITENNKNVNNDERFNNSYMKNVEINYSQFKKQTQPQIYTVMMDHERLHNVRKLHSNLNGCEAEYYSNTFEDIPRHPYDGFYLRHRTTIDSRGRKICIHEIPLSPPSPTPSLESSLESDDENEIFKDINYDRLNGEESQTGVAGNLAKVVPGEPQQQEAVDELTRRQGWEAGNIDYMGADSFDNIWAKISQTLSQPPSSPPRQPSPSNDQSVQPSEDRAVAIEEVKEAVVAPVESKPEEPVKGSIPSDASSETPVAVEAPVMASEVDASTASTETVENVVSLDAAETVAPTETSESVPPPEAPACVSLPVASDCVSSPEVPATVDATEPVVQIEAEATESVSPPEASEHVAQIEATESVSPPEASEHVAQIEATESVSPPEASEHVAQIEATESVSPPEASEHVAQIEATCVSSPQPSENIPIVESKETVAPPVADVNVASTEVLENVSAPATPVAPAESIDSLTAPEPPAPATENKDDVVPETSPAAASIEEPVVDVPVPASEAAESPGKQEDPIPVPAEIAAIPKSMPDESQTEMEPSGDIPVTAEEAIKIDIACVPKSSEMPAVDEHSDSPLNKSLATNEQSSDKKEVASDSPPLANTPSKEEIPSPPAAKTEERRKPLGKLSLPPAACDTLPTPDSELEDAASLAHAIIAGELRTPTVTSPSPPVISSSPQTQPSQTQARSLSIDQPEAPTPPLDSPLSLSQIGVKSKPTIASQIETSVSKTESAPTSEVSEAPKPKSDAPKKKIVKKVVKKVEKEGGASGDAPVPVPPPRKKEKKPKEK